MDNVLIGKTIRAMYKLSGKTLPQLSEESGLTVDSINNLLYARLQKPALCDIYALTKAMGFQVNQLTEFIEACGGDTDNVTEAFTLFINKSREQPQAYTEQKTDGGDRLEKHYEQHLAELKDIHADEMKRQDAIIEQNQKTIRRLRTALICIITVFFLLSMVDMLNLNMGWLR